MVLYREISSTASDEIFSVWSRSKSLGEFLSSPYKLPSQAGSDSFIIRSCSSSVSANERPVLGQVGRVSANERPVLGMREVVVFQLAMPTSIKRPSSDWGLYNRLLLEIFSIYPQWIKPVRIRPKYFQFIWKELNLTTTKMWWPGQSWGIQSDSRKIFQSLKLSKYLNSSKFFYNPETKTSG